MGGTESLIEPILPSPNLFFQYTRRFNPSFSMSLNAGFGTLPIAIIAPGNGTYSGNDQESIINNIIFYSSYLRTQALVSYSKTIHPKWFVSGQLGVGFRKFGNAKYGSQYYVDSGFLYQASFETKGRPILFGSIGTSLTRRLANQNELSLNLSYDHSFKNLMSGPYSLYDYTNHGNFFNQGRFLNIGISYGFLNAKKLKAIEHFQSAENLNRKAAKRKVREQLRYIDPNSTFLRLSGGTYTLRTMVTEDPQNVTQSAAFPNFMPQITYEMGLGKQWYAEGSIFSNEFLVASKYTVFPYMIDGTNGFRLYQFSAGALYRLILPNNYNLINFHMGLSAGFHTQSLGTYLASSAGGSGTFNNLPFAFSAETQFEIVSRYIGSAYLGLSKDFRIFNRCYFTMSYRHNFGIKKMLISETFYTDLINNQSSIVTKRVNGTGTEIQFGLKFKLNK
ncbi:MAG: hypothetical protein RLZZ65_1198 [Bacteroidota bacterium]